MKVIIYFLILSVRINYAVEIEFLPNPFLKFSQHKIFETNSSKWVEQFGLTADSQKQHFRHYMPGVICIEMVIANIKIK